MEFLAEVTEEVCGHISPEHPDETEIVVAAVDAWITGIVCVGALARVFEWIDSFGPYFPE